MSFHLFRATVGEDRVIRLPDGVTIPPGDYAIIVSTPVVHPPIVAPPSSEEDDIASLRAFLLGAAETEAVAASPTEEEEIKSLQDLLVGLAAEAERLAPRFPSDLAVNHDHYAHGKPLS